MLKAGTAARRRSVQWPEPMNGAAQQSGVERFLDVLDRRLQERDPNWVGHCKLLLTSPDGSAYASMTAAGDRPRWAGRPGASTGAEITIYVAIYGLTDGDVAAALDGVLAAEPLLGEAGVAAS